MESITTNQKKAKTNTITEHDSIEMTIRPTKANISASSQLSINHVPLPIPKHNAKKQLDMISTG